MARKKKESVVAETVTDKPEILEVKADAPIAVLIPYLKSDAAGQELKYALRVWEKNFKEDFRVVVVGDKEDWFSDQVVHIPHEVNLIPEECGCEEPKLIRNPQADVAHKLLTAIASGEVQGDFILTNDDIFILGDQTLSDMKSLRFIGALEDLSNRGDSLYRENALRTAKLLKLNQKPTLRFGTHTPVLLNADLLADTLREYHCVAQGTLVTSLYFNHHYPEARGLVPVTGGKDCFILASVYRSNPDPEILQQALNRRKYINCNSQGWEALQPIFQKRYPKKSRFEN